jgi:hypothetical protein
MTQPKVHITEKKDLEVCVLHYAQSYTFNVQSHKWFYFIGCHAILKKYSKKIIQTNGRTRESQGMLLAYFEKSVCAFKRDQSYKSMHGYHAEIINTNWFIKQRLIIYTIIL